MRLDLDNSRVPLISALKLPSSEDHVVGDGLINSWDGFDQKVKEELVVTDVLNILSDVDGMLFSVNHGTVDTLLNRDESLCSVAIEILQLALYKRNIKHYISTSDDSFIRQSSSEVLIELIHELQKKLCQFEYKNQQKPLGLNKLKIYLQPAIATFETLSGLVMNKNNIGFINELENLCRNIEENNISNDLFSKLFNNIIKSYFYLIKQWIYYSVINDPFNEFFLVYKDDKVTIDRDKVPNIFKNIAEVLLITGKFNIQLDDNDESISSAADVVRHILYIYNKKSNIIFNHLININFTNKLGDLILNPGRTASDDILKRVKSGYSSRPTGNVIPFASSGNFIPLKFSDGSSDDVVGNPASGTIGGTSSLEEDECQNYELKGYLPSDNFRGIITSETSSEDIMASIFGDVLLECDYFSGLVERIASIISGLSEIWLCCMKMKHLPLDSNSQLKYNLTTVTRDRMGFFCNNIVQYINFDVLLVKYNEYIEGVKSTINKKTLIDLIHLNEKFVTDISQESLLSDEDFHTQLLTILEICHTFITLVYKFLPKYDETNRNFNKYSRDANDLFNTIGYNDTINAIVEQYNKHLDALNHKLNKSNKRHLILKINFNNFYVALTDIQDAEMI